MGYPQTHPHRWEARDTSGHLCILLSKRDDYKINSQIMIDVDIIGAQSHFYVDHSPARTAKNILTSKHTTATPPLLGEVNSDVIVMVHAVENQQKQTVVSGTVFYFDARLRDLQNSLRSAFREKAPISVTTHLKDYNFHSGHTYIFENLRDVTTSHDRILATDAHMPRP